jgi:hypothetical protein
MMQMCPIAMGRRSHHPDEVTGSRAPEWLKRMHGRAVDDPSAWLGAVVDFLEDHDRIP